MAKLRSIIAGTIEFAQAWFSRFVGVQGFDRAMALAAQSFSALIPIMMIYGAAAPGHDGQDLADEIVDKFDLTGSAAATVHDAFQTTQDVSSTITVLGVFFILVSALSFSRGMQRLYEGSYGFSTLGVR